MRFGLFIHFDDSDLEIEMGSKRSFSSPFRNHMSYDIGGY